MPAPKHKSNCAQAAYRDYVLSVGQASTTEIAAAMGVVFQTIQRTLRPVVQRGELGAMQVNPWSPMIYHDPAVTPKAGVAESVAARRFDATEVYIDALRAAGKAGLTNEQICEMRGCCSQTAGESLRRLVVRGLVVGRTGLATQKVKGHNRKTWFLTEFAPSEQEALAQAKVFSVRPKYAKVCPEQQAIIPEHVQTQTLWSGQDHRFTVRELPPGYQSQINAAECRPWAAAVMR